MRAHTVLALALSLLAAGCGSLPRGAGLQREVLARSATQDPAERDFAVEVVTRDTLARYAAWPAVGETPHPWIDRVDQPNTRIIAPGDTVGITIWNTEEYGLLTSPGQRFVALPPMRVAAGGTVFLPYVGEVRISGMAPETARARIEERYLEVTPSVQVQFELTEGRQNTASVIGGVGAPGVFPLVDQDVSLLEVLALAGGVSSSLLNPQIRLQRGDNLYGVSVDRLLDEPSLNTTLVGGDRVFVEADDRTFLSLGATQSQAVHPFPQDEVTALDAMSIVGGLSATRANAKGILVLRRYAEADVRPDGTGPIHARTIFVLDLTSADGLFSAGQFLIRPGDLVYATESPLIATGTVLGLVGTVFGLGNAAQNL